jgi:hypothetical protein
MTIRQYIGNNIIIPEIENITIVKYDTNDWRTSDGINLSVYFGSDDNYL